MSSVIIIGEHIQSLIAAILIGQKGHQITIVTPKNNTHYDAFYDGCKTGDVTHTPLALPKQLIDQLDLGSYGFSVNDESIAKSIHNPFKKLPFYDGLVLLVEMFLSLDDFRPPYNEKAWRDVWSNYEIGRVLSTYDEKIQDLFAKSATLSLHELLDATDLSDEDKAAITMQCILGAKTNPAGQGSAASILPAIANFERKDHVFVNGSLHTLSRALKQSAMAQGATFIDDKIVEKIITENNEIRTVSLSGGETIAADYYIVDHDPVDFFMTYLDDYPLMPAFRNRVSPLQNKTTTVQSKLVIANDNPIIPSHNVAPSLHYIQTAMDNQKRDGGSQYPCLSIVNCSAQNRSLAKDGYEVFHIMAQYFEEEVQEEGNFDAISEAISQAVKQSMPEISDKITYITSEKSPTQLGQPNFIGTKPLLQLFKIFSKHHALGFDLPIANMVFSGYGFGCAGHYHILDGGEKVALLFD